MIEAMSVLLLAWLSLIQITVIVGWLVGLELVRFSPVISWLASAGLAVWLGVRSHQLRNWVIAHLSGTLIAFCIFLIAALSHDLSSDGIWYHREAIVAIGQGWNPLKEPVYLVDPQLSSNSIWLSHYAKGPWIMAASIFQLTGSLEPGKGVSYLLALTAGVLTYQALISLFEGRRQLALIFSILAALNPVFIYQIQSYYFDTHVASLLTVLTALICLQAKRKEPHLAFALIVTIILAINTKFSLLPFVVVISLVSSTVFFLVNKRPEAATLIKASVAGTALGLIVGFNPYFTNLLNKGHPFFPLYGKDSVDIITGQVGEEFLKKNRLEKIFLSNFSEVEHRFGTNFETYHEQVRLKIPLTVSRSELESLRSRDVRISGFGPLFGSAIILVSLGLLFSRRIDLISDSEKIVIAPLLGLIVSVLLMPEAWWARYVPQVWLITVLAAYVIFAPQNRRHRVFWGRTATLAIAANVVIVAIPVISFRIVEELDFLAQSNSLSLISDRAGAVQIEGGTLGAKHLLTTRGLQLQATESLSCDGIVDIILGAKVCIPRDYVSGYQDRSPFVENLKTRVFK